MVNVNLIYQIIRKAIVIIYFKSPLNSKTDAS
jgi:hypothetical protein